MPSIVPGGAGPVLFRRGSRMLPAYPDLSRPWTRHTGTAAVQADDAVVVATAGQVLTGTAAVQAQDAAVRAFSLPPPATFSGPSVFINRRPGRFWVIDDQRIYKNIAVGTKEGTAAALASPVSVSITAIRKVTGTAAVTADASTVFATSSDVFGVASAFASSATVVASGDATTVVGGNAVSGPAYVSATGVRKVTGSAAPQAQDAAAAVVGGIVGFSTGVAAAVAGDASVTATASRGFTGTVSVTASDASVAAAGDVVKPLIPVFDDVPVLLSRQWRDTSIAFTDYLRQGDEPITWMVVSGTLPDGLTLDTVTGVVSGTPTTIGFADLIIRATNVTGAGESDEFRWLISDTIPKNGLFVNQNVVTVEGV